MASIELGQENTTNLLNFFSIKSGAYTDAYKVEFVIFDNTAGPVQLFPATGREEVTTGDGKYSTGSYYAYDNANARGVIIPIGNNVGAYYIKWYVKFTSDGPEQEFTENFTVLPSGAGDFEGQFDNGYVTIEELRAEGITATILSDTAAAAKIKQWSNYIDEMTGQFFNARRFSFYFDGDNSDTLFLPFPVISVESMTINNESSPLDSSEYMVYNRYYPDDRRNPKISLRIKTSRNIFERSTVFGPRIFLRGTLNNVVLGTFGFVEQDGSTPPLIKRALIKLITFDLDPLYSPGGGVATPAGTLMQEKTVDHSYKLGGIVEPPNGYTWTGDKEVDDIIKNYRRSTSIGTTIENFSIRSADF